MPIPVLHACRIAGHADLPLLAVLPSLGTAAAPLWSEAAELLAARFQVVAVDLPGHGGSPPCPVDLTMADLAAGLRQALQPFAAEQPFCCAGVSIGGAITLQLAKDAPQLLRAAVVLSSAAQIGEPAAWLQRAELVRQDGTAALRQGSQARWFAPGFTSRNPARADALLATLEAADGASYAALCAALARFDLRASVAQLRVPMLVIGGAEDQATPAAQQTELAAAVPGAELAILPAVAHLAPAENPAEVARLIAQFAG